MESYCSDVSKNMLRLKSSEDAEDFSVGIFIKKIIRTTCDLSNFRIIS
jgi:hypothetical protein